MSAKSEETRKPAKHKVFSDGENGNRYAFYCDLSGILVCRTQPIRADTPDEELKTAWETARTEFNVCTKCHRNICNTMFNVDVSECVDCSPWIPPIEYCSECGAEVQESDRFCGKCGRKIPWEGVDEYAAGLTDKKRSSEKRKEYRETMLYYGFGIAAAKKIKVCSVCGTACGSEEGFCRECGARLPEKNLYQQSVEGKPRCPRCNSVYAHGNHYCSLCGVMLNNDVADNRTVMKEVDT